MGEPSLYAENTEAREENELHMHNSSKHCRIQTEPPAVNTWVALEMACPEAAVTPLVTSVAEDAHPSSVDQDSELAIAYKNLMGRKKGPHKLSGAGRRKLIKLRQKGVPEDRARQIVRENKELRKIKNSNSF